jgi:peroxiredoxin
MGSFVDSYKSGVSKARREPSLKWVLILAGLLVCSLGVNLLLARRLASLKTLVSLMRSESRLSEGDQVPSIAARDLQGRTAMLDYGGTNLPTVLFVITPGCEWCTKNIMNMRTLAEKAGDRYRFVALSLDSEKLIEYVTGHKLNFPIYTDLPYAPTQQYKLGGTPQTIVVSPQGVVMKTWSGAFAEETQKDVESYFKVRLPGIMDPETAVNTSGSE